MIYTYKATLSNSKVFMREFEVKADMKLFKFHEFIQNELSFAPDQMVCFEAVNEKGKIKSEYGLFDFGDGAMDTVSLADTVAKGEEVIRYVFDLKNYRFIELTLISQSKEVSRESYPRTIAEKGKNPDQFSIKYEEIDEFANAELHKTNVVIDDGDDDDIDENEDSITDEDIAEMDDVKDEE